MRLTFRTRRLRCNKGCHLSLKHTTATVGLTLMYLMARVIKSMGIKMVLSGEGADEIFGGYLYFHKPLCFNFTKKHRK